MEERTQVRAGAADNTLAVSVAMLVNAGHFQGSADAPATRGSRYGACVGSLR